MIGRHSNILLNPAVERRVIRVRRHWAVLLKPLLQTVGVVIVAFVLSSLVSRVGEGLWLPQSLLWYVAVGAVLRFAWKVLEWWLELIIVTDKRFMITSGIIQTKHSMMPITKVTDMSFLRPFAGQLFGYGTLRVESAGQKQDLERIEYVPRPEEVFEAISELIFGDKKQPRSHMLQPPRRGSRRRRWPLARWSEPEVW
ncbi:MAG: PH domain-containing protein [Pseudonocardiales bacterium]|nr:PH domain-containing protein [Pseudonocardiales bacterium]MBV9032743.1 PH domain-containing protein [Pseudonocardiales bacterium]MBW0010214.1 PH domain-containing protein [Pseudonocardiales bacterium]